MLCQDLMPVQEVVKKIGVLTLDMKHYGPPEPAVKIIFVDTRFGIEVPRSDFILLLQSREETKCEENPKNRSI